MKRTYFPRQILVRLEETICSELNLKESHQHRLFADKDNKKTGFLEIAKPVFFSKFKTAKNISKTIGLFYKKEGYNINIKSNFIRAGKRKENYCIIVAEGNTS